MKKNKHNNLSIAPQFLAIFLVIQLISFTGFGQKPTIKSVDKISAGTAELVTITGENFDTDPTKLAVTFGAVKGTIKSATAQVIEVEVPPGTTFNEIAVTLKTSGLTGYYRENFLLSYGGQSPIDPAKLEGQFDFQSGSGLYDICLCDFDGDGKVDVATANDNTTSIDIFANSSSGPDNVNFNKTSIPLAAKTLHAKCGDLNGDGKPDIVLTEAGDGDRVFVLKNNSSGTGNFSFSPQVYQIAGNKTKRIEIADLDLDGKPEVIITDQSKNSFSVMVNNSTMSAISFADNILNIPVAGAVTTDGIAVGDLNGDFIPEIVVTQFQAPKSHVFVVENKSTPGTINLGPVTMIDFQATVSTIQMADFDGDRKKDLLVVLLSSDAVTILRNQTTGNTVSFAAPKTFTTNEKMFGAGLGDLDGDGKIDIVVCSLTQTELNILNNTSTSGSLSFTRVVKPSTYITRHARIADIDTDGIPDIVFTSIDKNNAPVVPASKVSIFKNNNCLVPTIRPDGPINVCAGNPVRLTTVFSRGTSYQWKEIGTNTITNTPNPYLDITASGDYIVTANSPGCSQSSTNTVKVTISAGAALPGTTAATSNGPICVGSTLQLSVNNVGDSYSWSGPNGFTSTQREPTISNFQPANVGKYSVEITKGGCLAGEFSTVVEAIEIGSFTVTYSGSNVICAGDSKVLNISPNIVDANMTYNWFNENGSLGLTGPSITVTTTGKYLVKPNYPGCSITPTAPANIIVATLPVAAFTPSATDACSGQNIQFNNQSTVDPNATVEYLWTFGDGKTSNLQNPKHAYLNDGTFNPKLKVSYTGGACPNETTPQTINVIPAPVPTIINANGDYDICAGETLTLEVTGGTYNSFSWSTGETSPTIDITTAGSYSVEVTTSTCTLNAEKVINELNSPTVTIFADRNQINEGESVQLNAEGLNSYAWTPEESLNNPTIPNPIASPSATTVYTVSGLGNNGCTGTGTFELRVKGEPIVTKLSPKNFFSPNDDATNQLWVIENILDYPQCNVAIYDEKGIKVYESKPYSNEWDGTFNGKKLPKGVYFYIIKCDGEENKPKAGSITLLR